MNSSWIKRHKFLSSFLLIILLVIGIIGSNSTITSWFLMSWLKDHAQDVDLQELKLSLWNSQLDIEGLVATNGEGRTLAIESISINWVLSDLWDRQLTIKNIKLVGLQLNITASDYSPSFIGPFDLNRFKSENESANGEEVDSNLWALDISAIHLSNTTICYQASVVIFNGETSICIEGQNLELDTSLSLTPDQSYQLSGNVNLTGFTVFDRSDNVWFNLDKLNINSLSSSPKMTHVKQINLSNLSVLAQNKDDLFADNGALVGQLTADNFTWQASTQSVSIAGINSEHLIVNQRASNQQVMKALMVYSVNLTNIFINHQQTTLDSILVNDLFALESINASENSLYSDDYLTHIANISLDKLAYDTSKLSINKIDISTFEGVIVANPNGLNLTQWMPNIETIAEAEKETVEAIENLETKSFQFDISEINIGGDSTLIFSDETTGNIIAHEINGIELHVKNLQLGNNSSVQSDLNYSAKIGKSGNISGEGYFQPHGNSIDLDIIGSISSIDLVNLTDYSAQFIGYRIDRGLLNAEYKVKIKDNQINAKIETLFEKFELANLQAHEQSETNEQLGIPLPLALNLLRDSNDNIEIEMPITGDVNAPDFSISNILTKVTFTAIKNAVIYNYSPLGMLSLASGVFDLATALRFDPIIFDPQSTLLSDKSKQQLNKITTLMLDKPKVKFVICAQATHMDRLVVEAEPEARPFDPKPLLELAKQRQLVVTDYLMRDNNIDASRLIGCNAKLNKNTKAAAKVDISI